MKISALGIFTGKEIGFTEKIKNLFTNRKNINNISSTGNLINPGDVKNHWGFL